MGARTLRRALLGTFLLFGVLVAIEHRSPPSVQESDVNKNNDPVSPDVILRMTAVHYALDCTTRLSVVINETVPGPELRFKAGTKVWIRVYNDMDEFNATLHWHGIQQRGSPDADGSPMLSQYPISPLQFFDYIFQLDKDDAGTYFYHSHIDTQLVTATGAFIVEEQDGVAPPFAYAADRVLFLTDVFHAGYPDIINDLTNNIALNGRSRSLKDTSEPESPSCSYEEITVEPGKTYRFRIIGAMALSHVFVGFEGHRRLTLIEVDGRYVSPLNVDHIQISPGQRYSFLLRTKTLAELTADGKATHPQYWIQMEPRTIELNQFAAYGVLSYNLSGTLVDTFTRPSVRPSVGPSVRPSVLPSVRPSVQPSVRPIVLPNETFVDGWLEDVLAPLPSRPYRDSVPLAGDVTRRIVIRVQSVISSNGMETFHMNGVPYDDSFLTEPYIESLYRDHEEFIPDFASRYTGGFDRKTRTYPASLGEILEIVWLNVADNIHGAIEVHPLHIHGDHFWDIGSGEGEFDPAVAEAQLQKRLHNGGPIKRDTSNLYRLPTASQPNEVVSWRAWRIRVDNPGAWMAHCHVVQHQMMGMMTVFVFGLPKDVQSLNLTTI